MFILYPDGTEVLVGDVKEVEVSYPKQSYFDDVADFHEKFELPLATVSKPMGHYPDLRSPSLPGLIEEEYRLNFMKEELREFKEACEAGNLHDAADALADLVWVALGTAHHLGLPFEAIWENVRTANMAKVVGPPDATHKRPGERIRKPEGWRAPDHREALGIGPDISDGTIS